MTTILVVENDKNHLLLYEQELLLEGYNIITGKDGSEALKKVKEHHPDLVVMDIILPDMSGVGLIEKLLCEHGEIPIIVYTAFSGFKNNFITWLAEAYIIKSSDLSELKNKIKEFIDKIE